MRKLHASQKKMILDFAGIISISKMPKKISEVDTILSAFKETQPEQYAHAYDVIILRKTDNVDATSIVAAKVSEIVESNVAMQESEAIRKVQDGFLAIAKESKEEIKIEAQREIAKARKEFVTYQVKVGNNKPKKMKKGTVLPEEFPKLLELAQERVNILMVGPAGCGKTHVAGLIADALDLSFASQSCSAGVSESVFTGWLLPTGSNAKFTHVMSAFLDKYENGGVFLLDELDASDPNVLVFINQALANDCFMVPQRFEKPLFKKHKDFIAVAAANTFGHGADEMYHGRNSLDAATLDRFKIGTVAMDYSTIVEQAIIEAEVLEWGLEVRRLIASHSLQKIMSTRVMKDATTMFRGQDWSMQDIANSYFADWSAEEKMLANELMVA